MNRIKELRKKAGWTQQYLAKLLHISQGTLSYWENGHIEIDKRSLEDMSEIFGVSPDYITGESQEQEALQGFEGIIETITASNNSEQQKKPAEISELTKLYMDEFKALSSDLLPEEVEALIEEMRIRTFLLKAKRTSSATHRK